MSTSTPPSTLTAILEYLQAFSQKKWPDIICCIRRAATEKIFSDDDVFTINNIEVSGKLDLKFSREKYLNRAFVSSFDMLMNKILVSRDLTKVKDIKLKKILEREIK